MDLSTTVLADVTVTDWTVRSLLTDINSRRRGLMFLDLNVGNDEFGIEMDRTEGTEPGCAVHLNLTKNEEDITSEYIAGLLVALRLRLGTIQVEPQVAEGRTGVTLVFDSFTQ